VLDIQSPVLNGFTENDVRVLKTVADQIAVALGNARLYEQLRLQLRERTQKENILRIQRDLVVTLSSLSHPEEILQMAVKILSRELNVPLVEIFLIDTTGTLLVPVASEGYPVGHTQPIDIHSGIVGWVYRHRQAALFGDVQQVPYYYPFSPDTRSEICAPLASNNTILGVINLESPQVEAFSAEDLRMLTVVSSNLVVLMEKARLFSEVERARAELEARAIALESANERLRELDRLKSQFLANISHELRTPLNSIIGFSEVILDGITGPLLADQREYVQYIHGSGKHLLDLINDLLDFSKIESGRMQLECTHFQMEDLLDEVRALITPQIEKKEQELVFELEGQIPPIQADRLRMRQVFFNLLSNANKFTAQGGKIKVICQPEGAQGIFLAVQDNGIGIRAEDQKMIFEEFRQVDGSLTREVAGTGLGLAISKRIIELHHGRIWVESEFEHGSTFYIRLPISSTPDML
jgi:signal transduction histidine kinase